jgi:hypothetical protein
MVLRAVVLIASAMLVMGTQDLSAQDVATTPVQVPPETGLRRGFWFSGGLGYGNLGCGACGGRDGSYSGGLALGGTINQKVVIGVGTNGWYQSQNGVTISTGTLTALVRYYPSAMHGLFLLGGIGGGTIHAEAPGFGSDTETGMGFLLGLGYDIRVGSNVSLTPYGNGFAVRTHSSDANVIEIGLGITLH